MTFCTSKKYTPAKQESNRSRWSTRRASERDSKARMGGGVKGQQNYSRIACVLHCSNCVFGNRSTSIVVVPCAICFHNETGVCAHVFVWDKTKNQDIALAS